MSEGTKRYWFAIGGTGKAYGTAAEIQALLQHNPHYWSHYFDGQWQLMKTCFSNGDKETARELLELTMEVSDLLRSSGL